MSEADAAAIPQAEEPSGSLQPRHSPGEASNLGLWTRSECGLKCSFRGLPCFSDDSEAFSVRIYLRLLTVSEKSMEAAPPARKEFALPYVSFRSW